MNGACLSKIFDITEQTDASETLDRIKFVYEQKYVVQENFRKDGFKEYYFGNEEEDFGKIFMNLSQSNDGELRFFVNVHYYGPYLDSDDI